MSWEAAGYPSEPITADPVAIETGADHLNTVARVLRDQAARLEQLATVDRTRWDSDAAAGFTTVVKALPGNLAQLATRYEKVAGALGALSGTVQAARAQAETGRLRAIAAADAVAAARAGVARMDDHGRQAIATADTVNAQRPPDQPPAVPEPWTGPDHHAALAAAERDLAVARQQVADAVRAFHDAAGTAAGVINGANRDDLANDESLFGDIKRAAKWINDRVPLQAISAVLTKVSAIAGMLSLLPIPGAQVLAGVALAAAVGVLLCDSIAILAKMAEGGSFTAGDALTIGVDMVCVVASGVAFGAALKTEATAVTAGRTAADAGMARSAARVATEGREAAELTVELREARLAGLRSGWQRPINFLTGRTGAAKAEVAAGQSELERAAANERSLVEYARMQEAEAAAANRTWQRAESFSGAMGRVNDVLQFAGPATVTGNGIHDGESPMSAALKSGGIGNFTTMDVVADMNAVADFHRGHATIDRAATAGRQIPSRAVP
jgi:hypothetical protein